MTITDIKNQILSFFSNEDMFVLDGPEAKQIELNDKSEPYREELLRSALVELEIAGIVKRVSSPESTAWILVKSFGSFTQQVTLSPYTIEWIANTINSYLAANDKTEDICDKSNITEKDIVNLLHILHEGLEFETDCGLPDEDGEIE